LALAHEFRQNFSGFLARRHFGRQLARFFCLRRQDRHDARLRRRDDDDGTAESGADSTPSSSRKIHSVGPSRLLPLAATVPPASSVAALQNGTSNAIATRIPATTTGTFIITTSARNDTFDEDAALPAGSLLSLARVWLRPSHATAALLLLEKKLAWTSKEKAKARSSKLDWKKDRQSSTGRKIGKARLERDPRFFPTECLGVWGA